LDLAAPAGLLDGGEGWNLGGEARKMKEQTTGSIFYVEGSLWCEVDA
jgi:hypothetical protein